MKKKGKGLLSAFVGCIVSVTSIPVVMPVSDANAVPETTYQNITIEQLKSVKNFILGNPEGITIAIDKTFDVNNDDRIDVFDLCMLKKAYAEQIQKTGSFYSLASEMIQDNDLKYGSSVMSDDFYSKRLIVKIKSAYDFSRFSPKSVISGFDNIYVVQFESYENAKLCASALEKDAQVEYIELDKYMKCEDIETKQTNSNSWGVEAIEADKYAEYLSDNYDSSVVVAVVDTGVSPHSFLNGRLLDTGYDLVDNDPDPNDKHFHGTHVAGTVVDCTPNLNINIMPVRVLDANGSGSNLNVGNGIRYATEHGADVINLSLGGYGCSEYANDSIEYAVENGVTVVVAAGNNNKDTKYYCPAHLDDCIVVSACDSEYKKANFSNYGDSVDVTAPGVEILSCVPGGDFETKNGTSMATPHISAAVAMIKYADKNATPAQIEQTLKDISLDLGDVGKDVYYGYGLPKLSKLINNASPDVPLIDSGQCGDNVNYTLDENGLLTISGSGDMTDFSYGNYAPWYEFREKINKIIIEDNVTSIGAIVFFDCKNLTSITIPNSITIIGNKAFWNCIRLTNITIPDSVTSIEKEAFYGCSSLTSINIPDSVTSIKNSVFSSCKSLTSITIPDSVTSIEGSAFSHCQCLESVIIPDGVTSIGSDAFYSCKSLTSITIPDSVTSIGSDAFYSCKSLTSITIPDSVTSIGGYIFYDCSNLTSVTISGSVKYIRLYAFYDCSNLTSVTIPDSVTSIELNAFSSCSSLTSIKILNPECKIYNHASTINKTATIYGYTGSTAQAYAETYNRTFVAID